MEEDVFFMRTSLPEECLGGPSCHIEHLFQESFKNVSR